MDKTCKITVKIKESYGERFYTYNFALDGHNLIRQDDVYKTVFYRCYFAFKGNSPNEQDVRRWFIEKYRFFHQPEDIVDVKIE